MKNSKDAKISLYNEKSKNNQKAIPTTQQFVGENVTQHRPQFQIPTENDEENNEDVDNEDDSDKPHSVYKAAHDDKHIGYLEDELAKWKTKGGLSQSQIKKRIELPDSKHYTALHYAAKHHCLQICKLLINKFGCDPDIIGADGETPLHVASRHERETRSQSREKARSSVLNRNANIDRTYNTVMPNDKSDTEGVIEYLVESGAQLDAVDDEKRTSLHHAVMRATCWNNARTLISLMKPTQIQLLINARDAQGATPLHFACRFLDGNEEQNMVQLLINNGALIDALDQNNCTPLHYCSRRKLGRLNVEILVRYAQQHRSFSTEEYLDIQDKNGNTALCLAAEHGCEETVKFLLESNAKHDIQGKELYQPIHLASKNGNIKILDMLLKANYETPHPKTKNKETPLHVACQFNRTGAVQYLIQTLKQRKGLIEHLDDKDYTPLLTAAYYDHYDCVRTLIKNGAKMTEVHDDEDRNIIQICAKRLSINVLKEILPQISRTTAASTSTSTEQLVHQMIKHCDKHGNNPFHSIGRAYNGHIHGADIDKLEVDVCRLLLQPFMQRQSVQQLSIEPEQNTSLNETLIIDLILIRNKEHRTFLHEACFRGKVMFVQYFLDLISNFKRKMDVLEATDDELKTCLHTASAAGKIDIVKLLIDHHANLDARDMNDSTPLHEACANNQYRCVKILIKNHAPIDDVNEKGCTPLHLAAINGHKKIVKFLLENGAKVHIQNTNKYNSLEEAILNDHPTVVEEFLSHKSWNKSMKSAQLKRFVSGHEPEIDTPLRKLIRLMPTKAEIVFNQCIKRLGNEESDQHKIHYNYELLEDHFAKWTRVEEESHNSRSNSFPWQRQSVSPDGEKTHKSEIHIPKRHLIQHNHPLYILAKSEREDLIKHELIDKLIQRKWSQFTRIAFITTFTFYLWYVSCYTAMILRTKDPQSYYITYSYNITDTTCENVANIMQNTQRNPSGDGLKSRGDYILKYMLLGLIALHLMKFLYLLFLHWQRLFYKSSLIELASLGCCLYYSQDYYLWQMAVKLRCPDQWSVGAIGILLAWLTLITYVQFTPTHGLFVAMLEVILINFLWFLPVLILLVVSFGFTFYMLLSAQDPFTVPIESLLRTFIMLNDVGYESHMYPNSPTTSPYYKQSTFFVYIIYAALMFILINNLLIAFAVGEIGPLVGRAKFKRSQLRIILISEYELLIPKRFLQHFYRKNQNEAIEPNRTNHTAEIVKKVKRVFKDNKKKEMYGDQQQENTNNTREQLEEVIDEQEKSKEDLKQIQNDIKEIQKYLKQVFGTLNLDKPTNNENKKNSSYA